jgi:hypothetical protein
MARARTGSATIRRSDAFPDGIGAGAHHAAVSHGSSPPWGMDGGGNKLDDFNNTVFDH